MRSRRKHTIRRGNALVELVVGLPILFILTFGSIEACNLNHLQQCATEASYQGGLRGIPGGTTETQVRTMVEALIYSRDIDGATIVIEGLDGTPYDNLVTGDKFRVTTTIPAATNLPMLSMICSLDDLESERIAVKN